MRVKLEQQFFRLGLTPPLDVVETASFLGQLTLLRDQGAAALMADSVARHFAALGLLSPLALDVEAEVPPVGLITLRGQPLTPITQRLVSLLRAVVGDRA